MNAARDVVLTQNPLLELQKYGQSIWLDYIRRKLLTSGGLKRLIENDGLRGVTSNPTIFDKAIAGSDDYDRALKELLRQDPVSPPMALFDSLEIADIQAAADILRPVYDETGEADGFASIEVSPRLARDIQGTITEARRLWKAVDRPNLMVKVPATPEGIPAILTLIAEGININITLMFSLAHYEAVANAYIGGLERNSQPGRVASVASFFVSRVDTAVDKELELIGTPQALALRGKAAVANARMAYQRFREVFAGERWEKQAKRGARKQRPLWASTGTKNPAYSDVLYVESLIGPDTINTMPPATLDAFRDHGRVAETITQNIDEAREVLASLARVGINLNQITEDLQREGVDAFSESLDKLLASLDEKRCSILSAQVDRQEMSLSEYQGVVDSRLNDWARGAFLRRLWAKDYTLWSPQPVPELTDRLGWLTLPETMPEHLRDLTAFANQVLADGFRHVVLLGMGGSSLAPEVFQRTFGNASGYPELKVLDSTHPDAVRAIEKSVDAAKALFLVSSKSGGTTETMSFFYYFWELVKKSGKEPGRQFVAITDPGTSLEKLADERRFRRVFSAPPEVGGRYSALTVFGLVPAALIGLDVRRVLDEALTVAETCAFCVPEQSSTPLALGAAMGELALAGRDKITFIVSPGLEAFPTWLEQLIAESTGKHGKGIVPVADEPLGAPEVYGKDRFFAYLSVESDKAGKVPATIAALHKNGHPVVHIQLRQRTDLGQEFFRWEIATAAAGSVLGINPFDQPDVQLAKELAKTAMSHVGGAGQKPTDMHAVKDSGFPKLFIDFLATVRPRDYFGLQAYIAPSSQHSDLLQQLRVGLRDRLKLATTSGFGPRFLHSTGQLHKGGMNTGVFLQLVDEPSSDVRVPETNYSFAQLIHAQAEGDYQALKQRGRRVLRVNLGGSAPGGMKALLELVRG